MKKPLEITEQGVEILYGGIS